MSNAIFIQRLEGAVIFISATFAYLHFGFNWVLYLLLLFVFDVFMIGYVVNPRVGAWSYNAGHSLIVPTTLVVIALSTNSRIVLGLACLWFAHIGIDRALGYGLKLTTGFRHTHLGDIGKK